MLFDDLSEAGQALVRARGRVIGDGLTQLAREYANFSSTELMEELPNASRETKPGIGLLLARVVLEEAISVPTRESYGNFMFRFGAHLKTSISSRGLSGAQRLALATATEKMFDALPTASVVQREDASAVRFRLNGSDISEQDWRNVLGMSWREFESLLDLFARELGEPRRPEARAAPHSPRAGRMTVGSTGISPNALPSWLSLTLQTQPDALVSATANWVPAQLEPRSAASIADAWSFFKDGRFVASRVSLDGLLEKVGEEWGPTNSADSLRSWNWMRLVYELAAIESGGSPDRRRSWTSICQLAQSCVPDDYRINEWLERAIGDFVASNPASARAWSAYAARLTEGLGHETALSSYSNHEKAALRSVWTEKFDLSPVDSRSTATAVSSLGSRYKQCTQKLYVGARQGRSPARVLRETSHDFDHFLDESESAIFADTMELLEGADGLFKLDDTNHRDLKELKAEIGLSMTRIALSGSTVLQDYVAPLAQVAIASIGQAEARLGDISRPEVMVRLSSSKLPFSAAAGSIYEIRLLVTNGGNATAENVTLQITQADLNIDATSQFDALGPGAQVEVSVEVRATGSSERVVDLLCNTRWTDALLQQFSASQQLQAEDQMPATWSADDVNPFSLGTISEPGRLVGRSDDLASLDALLAGNASAHVTGHKRVGKTSLTRVLLRSMADKRGWAGSLLPLGRALGREQKAGDLVFAILDEILDAAHQAFGAALESIREVESSDTDNFARVANKWLRSVARALPSNARVVIAIDDFDELPSHLVDGPEADALFLFLRSDLPR